ncbi:hypothetical protein ScPMuIL_009532 [Solemya velum]
MVFTNLKKKLSLRTKLLKSDKKRKSKSHEISETDTKLREQMENDLSHRSVSQSFLLEIDHTGENKVPAEVYGMPQPDEELSKISDTVAVNKDGENDSRHSSSASVSSASKRSFKSRGSSFFSYCRRDSRVSDNSKGDIECSRDTKIFSFIGKRSRNRSASQASSSNQRGSRDRTESKVSTPSLKVGLHRTNSQRKGSIRSLAGHGETRERSSSTATDGSQNVRNKRKDKRDGIPLNRRESDFTTEGTEGERDESGTIDCLQTTCNHVDKDTPCTNQTERRLVPFEKGCYLTDLGLLSERLKHCQSCSRPLKLSNSLGVLPKKLGGWIIVLCDNKICRNPENNIPLSRTHKRKATTREHQDFDVNRKLSSALGDTGVDKTELKNLLCKLEVGSLDTEKMKTVTAKLDAPNKNKAASAENSTSTPSTITDILEKINSNCTTSRCVNGKLVADNTQSPIPVKNNPVTSTPMIASLVARVHSNYSEFTSRFNEFDSFTNQSRSEPCNPNVDCGTEKLKSDLESEIDGKANAPKHTTNGGNAGNTTDSDVIISPVTGKPIRGNQEALRSIYSRLNKYGIQPNLGVDGNSPKKQDVAKQTKSKPIEEKKPTTTESNKSDPAPANPGIGATPWNGSLAGRFQAAIWWILTIVVVLAYMTCFLITLNDKPVSTLKPEVTSQPGGS